METNGKHASKRQLAYIRRLQTVVDEAEPEITEEMSVSEASNVISDLVSKAGQNGVVVQRQINEPRLGMAMKECFRQWTALGKSIHDERRKAFIDYTIDTYNLFTEIAEKLGQAQRREPHRFPFFCFCLEKASDKSWRLMAMQRRRNTLPDRQCIGGVCQFCSAELDYHGADESLLHASPRTRSFYAEWCSTDCFWNDLLRQARAEQAKTRKKTF